MPSADVSLYAIGAEGTSLIKIGYTAGNVSARLRSLQTGNPRRLILVASVLVPRQRARDIESGIHQLLASCRHQGEWFDTAIDEAILQQLVLRARADIIQYALPFVTPSTERFVQMSHVSRGRFGVRLRKWRLYRGLSLAALARKTKTTPEMLAEWENLSRNTLSIGQIAKLCSALKIHLREFVDV